MSELWAEGELEGKVASSDGAAFLFVIVAYF